MAINIFAILTLRSTVAGDPSALIYLSSIGGHRQPAASVVYFPERLYSVTPITISVGSPSQPMSAPGTVRLEIDNSDGAYDAYLPGGASPQFWDEGTVTLYSGGTEGGLTSAMTTEFDGRISRGSLAIDADGFISFECYDTRVQHDVVIGGRPWSQHAQYDAATATAGVGGQRMPVLLGNWTATDDRLSTVLLKVTAGPVHTFGICNHEIGTVVVYNETTAATITGACTVTAATGYFTVPVGASFTAGDVLTVSCVGRPTLMTDYNPVRLIQNILVTYGSVTAATGIYNNIGAATNNLSGSFRVAYDYLGGATPDYQGRAYIDDARTVLTACARIAYESGLILTNYGGLFRLFNAIPDAASASPTAFFLDDLGEQSLATQLDPDRAFVTAAVVGYNPQPSDGMNARNRYDTAASVTSGPIFAARAAWGTTRDITMADDFEYIHGTGAPTAIERVVLWRTQMVEVVNAMLLGNDTTGAAWTVAPYGDLTIEGTRYEGVTMRAFQLQRDSASGAVAVQCVPLRSLITAGVWLDASGNDAAGNPINSFWGDANGMNGLDSAGSYI